MVRFILNNQDVVTYISPGTLLLDFVRYHQQLTGTKIGCREGDCGACTVLIGEIKNGELEYRSVTSCLTPLGNVYGKHVVTIEGTNRVLDKQGMPDLNPIQQAMEEESASQCGFCTPGFVMSLTGYCLSNKDACSNKVIESIDGNICRCTGYKSIERAANKVAHLVKDKQPGKAVDFVVDQQILPEYFAGIKDRLLALESNLLHLHPNEEETDVQFVGGGTDLYVQKHDEMTEAKIRFMLHHPEQNSIVVKGNHCALGPAVTVTNLSESKAFQDHFPDLQQYIKLVSSTPIRNIATVAGNFVNASPIGDFSIFFLALDATVVLTNKKEDREVKLRDFYLGYKQLDKHKNEHISAVFFQLPDSNSFFNFEKVSKRTHLDIASVNSAFKVTIENDIITSASISAGGVGPCPTYLKKSSDFMVGKPISELLIKDLLVIVETEVSPISDARGTAEYKRLLLSQLIKAHFIKLFPQLNVRQIMGQE